MCVVCANHCHVRFLSQVKDNKLVVGSTGKERTGDDGEIVHTGEMWVKTLSSSWELEHHDWQVCMVWYAVV